MPASPCTSVSMKTWVICDEVTMVHAPHQGQDLGRHQRGCACTPAAVVHLRLLDPGHHTMIACRVTAKVTVSPKLRIPHRIDLACPCRQLEESVVLNYRAAATIIGEHLGLIALPATRTRRQTLGLTSTEKAARDYFAELLLGEIHAKSIEAIDQLDIGE